MNAPAFANVPNLNARARCSREQSAILAERNANDIVTKPRENPHPLPSFDIPKVDEVPMTGRQDLAIRTDRHRKRGVPPKFSNELATRQLENANTRSAPITCAAGLNDELAVRAERILRILGFGLGNQRPPSLDFGYAVIPRDIFPVAGHDIGTDWNGLYESAFRKTPNREITGTIIARRWSIRCNFRSVSVKRDETHPAEGVPLPADSDGLDEVQS